jgi:hypothetical protein
MLPETPISIDTAIVGIAHGKMMEVDTLPDGEDKNRMLRDIARLQKERDVIYGGGTRNEYIATMNRVHDIYAPMIKDYFINDTPIGHLPN